MHKLLTCKDLTRNEPGGEARRPAGFIDAGDRCRALGQKRFTTKDFIPMLDSRSLGAEGRRAKSNQVIEEGRKEIFNRDFRNNEENAGFFELSIAMPGGSKQLDSAKLEPRQVIGMVNPSLAIRLLVANTEFDL